MVRDPFRRDKDSWLVLCDTWLPNGNPHPDNTRFGRNENICSKTGYRIKTMVWL